MTPPRGWGALLWLLAAAVPVPVIETPRQNTPAAQSQPTIVLVSLDGFRFDYARKYGATQLLDMAQHGVTAAGLRPEFPTLTFPSHYTLVTGLLPEHHGIVDMHFYDPARRQRYSYQDAAAVRDGTWYGGTPLWNLAEHHGMRAACLFWPGSEAAIQEQRPSFYVPFNDKLPNAQRVTQVLSWLQLPPARRPHLVTLYFSDVDHAGHDTGPDSAATQAAVRRVDQLIGQLRAGLRQLSFPINLVVVSDHGMLPLSPRRIHLEQYADLRGFEQGGSGPSILLSSPDAALVERTYQALQGHSADFVVYRRAAVPSALHYSANARIGDLVVVASGPWLLQTNQKKDTLRGMHGYDVARYPAMQGIFYAEGPQIASGMRVPAFENVHVYPFLAGLLGLPVPAGLDGSAEVLRRCRWQ